MPLKNWKRVPAENNQAPPFGWPEGQTPSSVNDCARQDKADVRVQWEDAEWFDWGDTPSQLSASTFKVSGLDVTSRYQVGRKVKLYDASTFYGVVTSSSYSAPDTTIGVTSSGSLTASFSSVALAILSPINSSIPAYTFDTITASGAAQFQSTVTVSGAAVFKTTATIEGTATISGAATFKSGVTIEGAATVSGAATFKSSVSVEGAVTISGAATLKGINILSGLTYPTVDGSANQVIKTNGSNVLSFGNVLAGATLISRQTAASSTTIDFATISNSLYDSYLVVGSGIKPTNDNVELFMRMSQGGVFNSTPSNYQYAVFRWTTSATGVSGAGVAGGGTAFSLNSGEALGNSTNEEITFWMLIDNCAQTTKLHRVKWGSTYISFSPTPLINEGGGEFTPTGAVDGFQFRMSTNTIASGIFSLYGLSNT